MKLINICVSLAAFVAFVSCDAKAPSPHPSGNTDGDKVPEEIECNESLTIKLNRVQGLSISDRLFGFNTVYANNPDALWADGKLADAIKAVRPGFLRYPGGTVTTYYHWNDLTGNGWTDAWDPSYSRSSDKSAGEFMSLDEYLSIIRKTGAQPMLGINCNSAFVYDRLEDGISEALALMQYVKDKGFDVKYWFIGNEPFAKDGNGGTWTPEQYSEMINAFAPKMKEFDPDIKIIVNDHANMIRNGSEYDTILQMAGQWVDVIDVHWYWEHGNATWAKWLKHTPCKINGGNTYINEVSAMHDLASKNGYPNLEFASLEWNCGPSTNASEPLETAGQLTLIQGEMLMQFMLGGLDMACFWPLFWNGEYSYRGMVDKNTKKLYPVAYLMRDLGVFQGSSLIETSFDRTREHVLALAAKSPEGTVRIAFLNKNNSTIGLDVSGSESGTAADVDVVSYRMDASLRDVIISEAHTEPKSKVVSAPYSLTIITLK